MAMFKDDAIVLRSVDFSETSLILALFTKNFGKVRVIAKGGRRLKSPFESSLDLLNHVRVQLIHKNSDALDILTESRLVHRFRASRENYAGIYAGYAALELADAMTEEGNFDGDAENVFELLRLSILDFEKGTYVMRSLLRFEWILLELLGHRPSLSLCVECGETVLPDAKGRVFFGHLDGGVLCERCREGRGQIALVHHDALETLEQLSAIENPASLEEEYRLRRWTQLDLQRRALGEARGLTNDYYSHLLGRRPKLYGQLSLIAKFDRKDEGE